MPTYTFEEMTKFGMESRWVVPAFPSAEPRVIRWHPYNRGWADGYTYNNAGKVEASQMCSDDVTMYRERYQEHVAFRNTLKGWFSVRWKLLKAGIRWSHLVETDAANRERFAPYLEEGPISFEEAPAIFEVEDNVQGVQPGDTLYYVVLDNANEPAVHAVTVSVAHIHFQRLGSWGTNIRFSLEGVHVVTGETMCSIQKGVQGQLSTGYFGRHLVKTKEEAVALVEERKAYLQTQIGALDSLIDGLTD